MSREQAIINDVITKVETFYHDLENGNIALKPEAKDAHIYETIKGKLGQTIQRNKGTLPSMLGHAIADYKSSVHPILKWEYAKECLCYIEWAYTHNLVEYPHLNKKISSLENDNKLLQDRLKECNQKCLALQKEMEGLRKKYFQDKGDTQVGEVGE